MQFIPFSPVKTSRVGEFYFATPGEFYLATDTEHDALDTRTNSELKEAIKDQLRFVNIVIILCGMYASHSKWIQEEMDIALAMEKPIIGIKPWGQERIPQEIQSVAKEIVGWNTSSIVDAIRKYAL